jgi:hypothetical protein
MNGVRTGNSSNISPGNTLIIIEEVCPGVSVNILNIFWAKKLTKMAFSTQNAAAHLCTKIIIPKSPRRIII